MKINLVIVNPKIEYGKTLLNYLEGISCDIILISYETKSINSKDKFLKWLNDNVSTLITQTIYMVYNKIKKRANFVDNMTLIGKIPIIYDISECKMFKYITGKEYVQI